MASKRSIAGSVNATLHRLVGVRLTRTPAPVAALPDLPSRPPAHPADRLVPDPVFLLSSVRSGSTLLRAILNGHSQIHAPHETHFRRLRVTLSTPPVEQAMAAFDLDRHDLEHLLWDRVLHRELVRSGKSVLVEKTPSNAWAVGRFHTAWPDARFVYLLRHPLSIATSWHDAAPDRRPMRYAIGYTLNYMREVERQRRRHPGLTVRYEDLTAEPERQVRRVTDFLGLDWEPTMLDYGAAQRGEFVAGIGDWRDKIRSGRVQPGRPLPTATDVPDELVPMCRTWGY